MRSLVVGFFLIIITCNTARGQYFTVTGTVTDSAGTTLANATAMALDRGDSTLVQFAVSRDDGNFILLKMEPGEYIMQISYVGYSTLWKEFSVLDENVDLGLIRLSSQIEELEEFMVTADRMPFTVRGDTIVYFANAFLVRPQDMVEDLLRRLPGIDVDETGSITAQGKLVEHVLVEGRDFFGKNPTVATKNLPADAVNQVEVFDKPSDLAELTGVPDGQDERAINLELKEEAKQGVFGQSTAGLGAEHTTPGRYYGRLSAFRFASNGQLAFIGSTDNVNQPGFGSEQLSLFSGSGIDYSRAAVQDGYTRSFGAGINASRNLGNRSTVNASYVLLDEDKIRQGAVLQTQLLGAAGVALDDNSIENKDGDLKHELILNADLNFGEGHDMVLRGSVSQSVSSQERMDSMSTSSHLGVLQSTALTLLNNSSDNLNGRARITWRKRIADNGRSLIVQATASGRDVNDELDLYTYSHFYNGENLQTRDETYQVQELLSHSFSQSQRIELLQPVRKTGKTLKTYIEYSATKRSNEKAFSDANLNEASLHPFLRNDFSELYQYYRSGLNFYLQNTDGSWWIKWGMEVQHSRRKGVTSSSSQALSSASTYILPNVLGELTFSKNADLNFFYWTRIREPAIWQLQPFLDNSNPLRLFRGNPGLTPEYHHDLNIQYSLKDGYTGMSMSADIGLAYTDNLIVRTREVDNELRQSLQEKNLGGAWSGDAGFNWSMPIRKLDMRWSVDGRTDIESGIEKINGIRNESKFYRNSLRLRFEYYLGNTLEITTSTRIVWRELRYSLYQALNQRYVTGRIDGNIEWYPNADWLIEFSWDYRVMDQIIFDGRQDIGLLHMAISRYLIAGRGRLMIEFRDLLNENQGITFTNGATSIEESRIHTLGRYIMLKFTYKPKLM